jgi:hypothetical protein
VEPPALENILSKERIDSLLDVTLGDETLSRIYVAVCNRQRKYISRRGSVAKCIGCSMKDKPMSRPTACFDGNQLEEWLSRLFRGEGPVWDSRPCDGIAWHYAFKIFGEDPHIVGMVLAGPHSDELIESAPASLPPLSRRETEFLTAQCWHLAEILSRDYRAGVSARDVWIAMPFSKKFESTYEVGLQPALKALGYEPKRVDRTAPHAQVMTAIHDGIRRCAFMVADVSSGNGNVMYEVGLATAMGKERLLVTRDTAANVPFSFRTEPYIYYQPQQLQVLITELQKCITAWQSEGSIPYRMNPS